jgi:hypothetical protein
MRDSNSVFRAINRLISEQAGVGRAGPTEALDLICECADVDCSAIATVTVSEFDSICSDQRLVLVGPGHAIQRADRLVESTSRFGVIESTT